MKDYFIVLVPNMGRYYITHQKSNKTVKILASSLIFEKDK